MNTNPKTILLTNFSLNVNFSQIIKQIPNFKETFISKSEANNQSNLLKYFENQPDMIGAIWDYNNSIYNYHREESNLLSLSLLTNSILNSQPGLIYTLNYIP